MPSNQAPPFWCTSLTLGARPVLPSKYFLSAFASQSALQYVTRGQGAAGFLGFSSRLSLVLSTGLQTLEKLEPIRGSAPLPDLQQIILHGAHLIQTRAGCPDVTNMQISGT